MSAKLMLEPGPQTTILFDSADHIAASLHREHRMPVKLEEMSPELINAVIVTEDRRFFQHEGVDTRRIVASWLANLRARRIVQGASTITQQFVRNAVLDRSKTYSRKVREAWLANRLEARFSKNEILHAYLNYVYLGDGYYGVESAARGYFGKTAAQLNAVEGATIAAMINRPSAYNLRAAGNRIRDRRDWVLSEMLGAKFIDEATYRASIAQPVEKTLAPQAKRVAAGIDPSVMNVGPYFMRAVTEWMNQQYGAENVLTGGYRVYTTLDASAQRAAEQAVFARLKELDKKNDENGPLQGAFVAIEPDTGNVRAMVGGRDFYASMFNRATEAKRQPGSAFKPFVFAAALEAGFSPGTTIADIDQAVASSTGAYLPADHELEFPTLRSALVHSSNRGAVQVLRMVGMNRAIDLANRVGLDNMPQVPSLALGTGEVTLLQLTSAYTAFANRGTQMTPVFIRRIEDPQGRVIYRGRPEGKRVMSEATAYMMASMLADVVDWGTGYKARAAGFKLRAGGKTGSTDDHNDAWFVGFTPHLAAGVWIGYDIPRTIMRQGFAAVVAVPVWGRFMKEVTLGSKSDWMPAPPGVHSVRMCRESGGLAGEYCELAGTARNEMIAYGRDPEPCPIHTGAVFRSAESTPVPQPFPQPTPAPATPVQAGPVPQPESATPPPPQPTFPGQTAPPTEPPASMQQQDQQEKGPSFRCRVFRIGCKPKTSEFQ